MKSLLHVLGKWIPITRGQRKSFVIVFKYVRQVEVSKYELSNGLLIDEQLGPIGFLMKTSQNNKYHQN